MALSKYHKKYADYSDEEIKRRADAKEQELEEIAKKTSLQINNSPIRLAVMGSGDVRFVDHHKRIFKKYVGGPVDVTTFDITVKHLATGKNIIQHDCTLPLPGGPYDITYAHVLLKFIEKKKQWDVVENSFNVLNEGRGIALHILDKEDYETGAVDLIEIKNKLKEKNIKFIEIPVKYGLAIVLKK